MGQPKPAVGAGQTVSNAQAGKAASISVWDTPSIMDLNRVQANANISMVAPGLASESCVASPKT